MKQRRLRTPSLRPSAVVVGLLLVVGMLAVLAWVRLFAPPTTADYRNAQDQATVHRELLGQLDAASGSYAQAIVGSLRVAPEGSRLADETADERAVFDVTVVDFIDSAERLAGLPATKDKQVREAAHQVKKEADRLEEMIIALTDDYDEYYRVYSGCGAVLRFEPSDDGAATVKRYQTESTACLKRLATLKQARTKELRAYAIELSEIIKSSSNAYTAIADDTPGNHRATLATLAGRLDKLDSLTTIQRIRGDSFSTASIDRLINIVERRQTS